MQKPHKNSLFTYYTKSVIDVEALDERRANEAKANSTRGSRTFIGEEKAKLGLKIRPKKFGIAVVLCLSP